SPAEHKALGAAMQACGETFGTLIAQGLAAGFDNGYVLDADSHECVKRWFASPDRQTLIAAAVLNEQPKAPEARQFADLMLTCLDIATLFQPEIPVKFDKNEHDCVNRLARTSDALRAAFTAEIAGSTNANTRHLEELFGASVVKCLTPEHLIQL